MAVRAASKLTRQANSAPTPGARAGGKSFPAPALAGWGAAETPQGTRHSTRSIVIAAVALVALMGGAFAALNAATRPSKTISKIVSNSSSRSQSRSVGARLSLPPQQNTGAASGSGVPAVKLANGVVVPVPDGWKVGGHGNVTAKKKKIGNWVQVGTDGAVVEVDSFKIKSGAAADLAQVFLNNVVSQQFQDIQLGSKSGPVQVQGVNADAYDTYFQGTVANDQGSVTVDGVFRTFVTSGHKVVIFEQANATGQFDTFKNDFGLIYTGVEGTLPS
jgi:hypothetical protein